MAQNAEVPPEVPAGTEPLAGAKASDYGSEAFQELARLDQIRAAMIPPNVTAEIYDLARDSLEYVKALGITAWADGGTMLGSVRHGELIPWDDDLDFGVYAADLSRIGENFGPMRRKGYSIERAQNLVKIFRPGKWRQNTHRTFGTPTCDFFGYQVAKRSGKTVVEIAHEEMLARWPGCFHRRTDLLPLTSGKFGPLEIPMPRKPRGYLGRLYPEWETKVVIEMRSAPTAALVNNKSALLYFSLEEANREAKAAAAVYRIQSSSRGIMQGLGLSKPEENKMEALAALIAKLRSSPTAARKFREMAAEKGAGSAPGEEKNADDSAAGSAGETAPGEGETADESAAGSGE